MIFGGPHEVRSGWRARDIYTKSKKATSGHGAHNWLLAPGGPCATTNDIVFTKADASWVHNPHENTLVITAKIANSLVHRLLVDNENAVNILIWGTYQETYSRYNQIPMCEPDEDHTSFITNQGLYCYKALPFGLKNDGATYQRLVN